MKASARILVTATTLAALTMLGPAATATAGVPQRPEAPQQGTTVEATTGPQPGHGAQLHHDAAPATASQPATDPTNTDTDSAVAPWIAALAGTVLGLVVGLAGAIWLGRRHRRPAAV
jgi:hypothetical protein